MSRIALSWAAAAFACASHGPAHAQGALDLGGTDAYAQFGDSAQLRLDTFTIELWMRRDGPGVGTNTGGGGIPDLIPLVSKGRSEDETPEHDINYIFGIRASDSVLVADFEEGPAGGDPSANHPVAGVTPIGTGTWHHVAATYDGSRWRLYLDGALEADLVVAQPPAVTSEIPVVVGSALRSTGVAAGFFDGAVDEVRIWNVARTHAEIIANANAENADSTAGLVARWALDEGAGSDVHASAGTTVDGTLAGAAWSWTGGAPFDLSFGGAPAALELGGTDAFVDLGNPASLALDTFTIELWFRRDGPGLGTETGSGGAIGAIPLVAKGRSEAELSSVDVNYFLGIRVSDGVLIADFEEGAEGSGPSQNHPVVGLTPIATGAWHHAAATYDGTSWRLYLDGGLEGETAVGQPPAAESTVDVAIGTTLNSGHVPDGFFDGVVDEVRIWNYARDQAALVDSMNVEIGDPVPGLVARLALDEGAGAIVFGGAGTGLGGTIEGADWNWTAGAPFDLAPPTPPNGPSDLVVIAQDATQVLIEWTDQSGNEFFFEIERSTTGAAGPFDPLVSVAAGTTSYEDIGLDPETEYCYRVRAVNGAGTSAYTDTACATTATSEGTAVRFDGTDGHADFGNPPELSLATFTLELWFRRDGPGVGTSSGGGGVPDAIPLLAKGRSETEEALTNVNYLLGIRASDSVLVADFEEGAGGATPGLNHPIAGVTRIDTTAWHHAAATYDGATWKLYLDGSLEAQQFVGEPANAANTSSVSLATALRTTGEPAGFFDGAVDEVRIWDHARTQAGIVGALNAQITDPTPGLVARWGLNEGAGTILHATAGTTADGTLSGTGWNRTASAPFDLSVSMPPDPPALIAPADDATGVGNAPQLAVSVGDPEADDLTVTFYGRPAPPAAGEDFTLIGLPDTQFYVAGTHGGSPEMFDAQTAWIVAERAARNVAYAIQLGDCVHNADLEIEWQLADSALRVLEDTLATGLPEGVPFGICVGNHDQVPVGDPDGSTDLYNQYFGAARFSGRSYYGGHYGTNNDNWIETFSAGGLDFIVVSLEYDLAPDAAVLAWADSVLAAHPGRRAIVATHWLMDAGVQPPFSAQGQAIYDALKGNPNLFLMLGGHIPEEGIRVDTHNGNTVYSLLSDYQARSGGGDGWLRIMEFSPANNVIRVRTYSPWLDQFEADADSSSQFTIPYAMTDAEPYQQIAVNAGVASGTQTAVTWPGLALGTAYEWYVTVFDGLTTVTSPLWRFTTDAVDGVAPQAQVTAPNGGETLALGAEVTLQWNATDNVGVTSVDLMLSRSGAGGPFEAIVTDVPNDGTFDWTVSGPPTADAWFQVIARDAAFNAGMDLSDAAFTIGDYALNVSVAGGGAVEKSPDLAAYPFASLVQLSATPDSGWAFAGWSGDTVASDNPLDLAMIAARTVVATFADTAAPAVAVLAPNGGESLVIGTEVALTWDAADNDSVTIVDLLLSRDGPEGPFEEIAGGVPNTGSFGWTVTGPASISGFIKVVAADTTGNATEDLSDAPFSVAHPTGVADGVPTVLALGPATPNPARGIARFAFDLPHPRSVHVDVVDVQGRVVATLARGPRAAGRHHVRWNGEGPSGRSAAGVYFVRLRAGERSLLRRFVYVR